jgi:peptidoglycan/LPS O-acetylase OafA/YrhL
MAQSATSTARIGWLDGLRGFAAMQVVFLHYVLAFLPGLGLRKPALVHYAWERVIMNTPLYSLFDGHFAVCIFFVLSGVALTQSFGKRPFDLIGSTMRRIVRLGLPMAAAVLFGAALFALMPTMHVQASQLTGAEYSLGNVGPTDISVLAVLHEIGLEGVFVGFAKMSILPSVAQEYLGLVPQWRSFNAPLWSLHVEFVGSLFVMLLVALRGVMPRFGHVILCCCLLVILASSLLVLFLVGHIAATRWQSQKRPISHDWFGVCLVLAGVVVSTIATPPHAVVALTDLIPTPYFLWRSTATGMLYIIGAVAVFVGISLSPRLQTGLGFPVFKWLGRISFSLYLTHFPVLFTISCLGFILLSPELPYSLSIIVTSLVGIGISLIIADVYERVVDKPAIRLSRLAGSPRLIFHRVAAFYGR